MNEQRGEGENEARQDYGQITVFFFFPLLILLLYKLKKVFYDCKVYPDYALEDDAMLGSLAIYGELLEDKALLCGIKLVTKLCHDEIEVVDCL